MNIKLLLNFIKRESGNKTYKTILIMSVISGLSNSLLLSVINSSTSKVVHGEYNYRLIIIFSIIFLIYLITKYRSLKTTAYLAEDIVYGVRERIVKYITDTELVEFEDLGRAEIYSRLTTDTTQISNSAPLIVIGIQSTLLVIFALIYLCFLNTIACLVTIVALSIGISNYFINGNKVQGDIKNVNIIETSYFEKINELTGGFKEIKINQQKKFDLFYGKIQDISIKYKVSRKSLTDKLAFYFVFAQTFFYILLGAIVFIIPVFDNDLLINIAKVTSTVIFVIMPLGEATNTIDSINKASVAITSLNELENRLEAKSSSNHTDPVLEGIFDKFEHIEFNNLLFGYKDKTGINQFSVGPINFEVNKGEIIFVIGGNGSGKSTLLKLITGLYNPDEGSISVDGVEINKQNIEEYRNSFGVIFSDFFLFSELYGIKNPESSKVLGLIRQMELTEKTGFKDNSFTNLNLSTGQRKRLAMISVILENKNILVFDEWAADQDPEFRKYFYDILIHDFIKQGKTIIAITHDDFYFDKADRIYKMDFGKFKEHKI